MCPAVIRCSWMWVQLDVVVGLARSAQRAVEGLMVRAAERADALARDGTGPGSAELLVGHGEVSAHQARDDAARAVLAGRFPVLREALLAGQVSGEHLDAVARVSRQLNELELEALRLRDADLAAQAQGRSVERFKRWLRCVVNDLHTSHRPADRNGAAGEPEPELRAWKGRDGRGHLTLGSRRDHVRARHRPAGSPPGRPGWPVAQR
jgi:hypothetical protein